MNFEFVWLAVPHQIKGRTGYARIMNLNCNSFDFIYNTNKNSKIFTQIHREYLEKESRNFLTVQFFFILFFFNFFYFGNARKGKRNSKKVTINACLIT